MGKKVIREHMENRWGKVHNFCENPPLPKSLNIELNSSCNQNCIFCPYHGKYATSIPKPAVVSYEMATKLLDEAKRLRIGEKEIGFYLAGEAFLHKDLARIIEYTKKLGYKYVFLTTNGALAHPDKMKEVLDAGLDSIRFSINAADRKTYMDIHGKDDFDAVVRNIKYMHQYIKDNKLNVATSVSCVLTKKTVGIQDKVRELFDEYVDDIIFIPVMLDKLKYDKQFADEYQLIDDSTATINEEYICPMLFDTMYINASLEVLPCCDAYQIVNGGFYDLKEDFNLEAAWNSSMYLKYRNIFLNGDDDKGTACENCLLRMKGVQRYFY